MKLTSTILISIVSLLHFWFMILESFLWTKPLGLKTFGMKPEMAEVTKVLALNQGLYNGFLAVGLLWGVCLGDFKIKVFFLGCVIVAGIVGGLTANKSIFFIQALPAVVALAVVLLSK